MVKGNSDNKNLGEQFKKKNGTPRVVYAFSVYATRPGLSWRCGPLPVGRHRVAP